MKIKSGGRFGLMILALFLGMVSAPLSSGALKPSDSQQKTDKKGASKENPEKNEKKKQPVIHEEVTVTATLSETTVFNAPNPVSVLNQKKIEERAPNNVSDLLPELPGLDVVGVGANQSRPVIRGLRGQRILLLTDGIRMSNSRRSQDFGEIPAMIDVAWTDQVDVVRGPSSVLYGSDAIGGVVNILTRAPDYFQSGSHITGSIGYRYGSSDSQQKGFANIMGNIRGFGFMLNGSYRDSKNYSAAAGKFGDIVLSETTPVLDSGVRDYSVNLFLGYRLPGGSDLSFKYERYAARDAGFGYVDPSVYSPGDPTIRLLYPEQNMNRYTLKFENSALNFFLADRISVTGFRVENDRYFNTDITIPFFPGAGMNIQSSNFTDIRTIGLRFELSKVLFSNHVVTYGVDFYRDDSQNTDTTVTTMFGFGPPMTGTDSLPKVPNADFLSFGVFLQDQWPLFGRTSLILGLRYQSNLARTKATEGLTGPMVESRDSTLVGAANLVFGLTDNLNLILGLGRGFRSPNLTERFFQGVTPDGSGYQIQTPDLGAETSLNAEAGFRYRAGGFYLESSYFRNTIRDGIAIVPTGGSFGGLSEYKNVNIDRLRFQGLEALGYYDFDFGLTVGANFSRIWSKNLTNPELPYTDTFNSRLNLMARYSLAGDRIWFEYHVRISGDLKDVELGNNPIGSTIPGFRVHTIRIGTTLFRDSRFPQRLNLIFGNLTDTLYSEISNTRFFRPAPGRHIVLAWSSSF